MLSCAFCVCPTSQQASLQACLRSKGSQQSCNKVHQHGNLLRAHSRKVACVGLVADSQPGRRLLSGCDRCANLNAAVQQGCTTLIRKLQLRGSACCTLRHHCIPVSGSPTPRRRAKMRSRRAARDGTLAAGKYKHSVKCLCSSSSGLNCKDHIKDGREGYEQSLRAAMTTMTQAQLQALAEQLQADPSKHAAHAAKLMQALQGTEDVSNAYRTCCSPARASRFPLPPGAPRRPRPPPPPRRVTLHRCRAARLLPTPPPSLHSAHARFRHFTRPWRARRCRRSRSIS